MHIHILSPVIKYGNVSFDFMIEDPNGVIPPYRASGQLPIDPIPTAGDFLGMVKCLILSHYALMPQADVSAFGLDRLAMVLAAINVEYTRAIPEHTLIIDRPAAYPTLGL
ncbi:MAG: hypothetical protein JWN86_1763 [Planctomycetota bacterium]|nr:hypothetical protein [Planctomycetota bacterium]